jgi:SAM-dependent methyltransferase
MHPGTQWEAAERMAKKKPKKMNKHELYEESVQCPEADVQAFDRFYKEVNGRHPRSMKEDFCGTAAICAEWVKRRKSNIAIGVDLDRPTLDWGIKRHIKPLGPDAERVRLILDDVRNVQNPKVDVVAALNFSYFGFKTREALRDYFSKARKGLAPDGILVLDIFGGTESQSLDKEEKPKKGYTYIWDQARFDPITHETLFYIHFRFKDGSTRRRAFTYDWRLWTIPEVREILAEAGYRWSRVYWEGTDHDTGDGNGVFRRVERAVSSPGWIAYITAGR